MAACCARSLATIKRLPLRTHRNLTTLTSNQTLNSSNSIQPKFSDGQDENAVMAELNALVENGWKLDDEQKGVRKTYYLKTYTKVLVIEDSTTFVKSHITVANNSRGPSPQHWSEKQI